jgi:hypothetical protein
LCRWQNDGSVHISAISYSDFQKTIVELVTSIAINFESRRDDDMPGPVNLACLTLFNKSI